MHPEIRNPKSEIRNKSEIQNPNVQNPRGRLVLDIRILDFGFVSDFGFRVSDFGMHVAILVNRGLTHPAPALPPRPAALAPGGEALNDVEGDGDDENAQQRRAEHAADDRRAEGLARGGAGAGGEP